MIYQTREQAVALVGEKTVALVDSIGCNYLVTKLFVTIRIRAEFQSSAILCRVCGRPAWIKAYYYQDTLDTLENLAKLSWEVDHYRIELMDESSES